MKEQQELPSILTGLREAFLQKGTLDQREITSLLELAEMYYREIQPLRDRVIQNMRKHDEHES